MFGFGMGRSGVVGGMKLLSSRIASLFRSGEQGVWYDPSDRATLFQDASGTTPVTAVEQPVGLILDKSKGLVLGPELIVNSAWTTSTGWSVDTSTGVATAIAATGTIRNNGTGGSNLIVGKWYQATIRLVSYVSGSVGYPYDGTGFTSIPTTPGTYTYRFLCDTPNDWTYVYGNAFTGVVDNISVRELPGNHAFQSTSASRPVLSARVNLLTYTEDFSNAEWIKVNLTTTGGFASPTGALTAQKLEPTTTASTFVRQSVVVNATSVVAGVYVKKGSGATDANNFVLYNVTTSSVLIGGTFNYDTGAWTYTTGSAGMTVSDAGGNWWRLEFFASSGITAGNSVALYVGYTGLSVTAGKYMYAWGADLRVANTGVNLPPYQRVGAATDYDTAWFPQREYFDGVDDAYTIADGGGGTTAFFFCACINVAAVGVEQTIISDTGTNTGYRVRINASNQLEISAGNGTAYTTANTTATVSIGQAYVITCWHDGTNLNAQINDGTVAQQAFAAATAGTASITVGKDNGAATRYFKGSVYEALYVKDDAQTAAQIASAKKYCATKGKLTI